MLKRRKARKKALEKARRLALLASDDGGVFVECLQCFEEAGGGAGGPDGTRSRLGARRGTRRPRRAPRTRSGAAPARAEEASRPERATQAVARPCCAGLLCDHCYGTSGACPNCGIAVKDGKPLALQEEDTSPLDGGLDEDAMLAEMERQMAGGGAGTRLALPRRASKGGLQS